MSTGAELILFSGVVVLLLLIVHNRFTRLVSTNKQAYGNPFLHDGRQGDGRSNAITRNTPRWVGESLHHEKLRNLRRASEMKDK